MDLPQLRQWGDPKHQVVEQQFLDEKLPSVTVQPETHSGLNSRGPKNRIRIM